MGGSGGGYAQPGSGRLAFGLWHLPPFADGGYEGGGGILAFAEGEGVELFAAHLLATGQEEAFGYGSGDALGDQVCDERSGGSNNNIFAFRVFAGLGLLLLSLCVLCCSLCKIRYWESQYTDIGIPDIRMLGFPIYGYWDSRFTGCWDFRFTGYWDSRFTGYWDSRFTVYWESRFTGVFSFDQGIECGIDHFVIAEVPCFAADPVEVGAVEHPLEFVGRLDVLGFAVVAESDFVKGAPELFFTASDFFAPGVALAVGFVLSRFKKFIEPFRSLGEPEVKLLHDDAAHDASCEGA